MLITILREAKAIMDERAGSTTIYSGWGSYLDSIVDDYIDQGGSWALVRKVLRIACK